MTTPLDKLSELCNLYNKEISFNEKVLYAKLTQPKIVKALIDVVRAADVIASDYTVNHVRVTRYNEARARLDDVLKEI